ncbi:MULTISPECIES: hypothetical protein [Methylobacterium]|uniref:hypothetical protein n=1 Tax=Methylobacterium TaxID=407 RepID=UPI002F35A4C6
MSVDITTIQALHRKIADEQARVRIELEPRLPTGFKTKASDFIEQIPDVQRSNAVLLATDVSTDGLFPDAGEAQQALNNFIQKLKILPRLTREFLGWMYDHATWRRIEGGDYFWISVDLVARKASRLPSVDGEIRLLREFGFIYYDDPDEPGQSAHFSFGFPGAEQTNLAEAFRIFTRTHKIGVEGMYSSMNFTPFGPAPSTSPKKPSTPPAKIKVGANKAKVR